MTAVSTTSWPSDVSLPLVSIIVPSYNQGRFLRETLDSCLSQDWRPLEVLVFDGGSTDESIDVLRSYGDTPELRWRSERDRGVVDAVNKGLVEARGEIIVVQSSDDVFRPGAIGQAVDALFADASLGFVTADVDYLDAASRVTGRTALPPFTLGSFLGKETYVPQPATFFRASAAREAGLWDESIPYAADAEYWLRIALNRRARKVDAVWAGYRYHEDQRDKASTRPARDWETGVRRLLEAGRIPATLRRRAESGIWLTWHHYTSEADWRRRTVMLYRAAAAHPPSVARSWFPKRELLPGREPIWKMLSGAKRRIGTLLLDRPRLAWPLALGGVARRRWVAFHNRDEAIVPGPGGVGFTCSSRWTSDLNLAREWPRVGRRLMRSALTEWPVEFAEQQKVRGEPTVSFVIGHRGRQRVPHLLATLRAIAGQSDVPVEAVVVEQDSEPSLEPTLPAWVRCVPAKPPVGMPYSRSWSFNVGARAARGRVLVFQDNDLLAPARYAAEVASLTERRYEAVRVMRYLFYLGGEGTRAALEGTSEWQRYPPLSVMQNAVGGSIAVTREAYETIGGHDEGFLGWGGEDNEFFDRLGTLRLWKWGYLPFVHLEHPAQVEARRNPDTESLLERRLAVPAAERIARLRALPWGSPTGPLVEEPR